MALPRFQPHRHINARDVNLVSDYIDSLLGDLLVSPPDGPPSRGTAIVTSLRGSGSIGVAPSTGDTVVSSIGGASSVYMASASAVAGQSVPLSTLTVLVFNATGIDPHTEFNGAGQFTAYSAGIYMFSFTAGVAAGSGDIYFELGNAGGSQLRRFYGSGINITTVATGTPGHLAITQDKWTAVHNNCVTFVSLTAGQSVEWRCFQSISSPCVIGLPLQLDVLRMS